MPAKDPVLSIRDIDGDHLRHRNKKDPSVAAIVECDGSVHGMALYGHHPLHYLWDTLDRGEFKPFLVEDHLVFWNNTEGGPPNASAMGLVGREIEGTIIVTPKQLNFGLYSGDYAERLAPDVGL